MFITSKSSNAADPILASGRHADAQPISV